MLLSKVCGFLAATFIAYAAFAQQPAGKPQILQQPDRTVTYASAADVADLIARAKRERKDDPPLVVGSVLQLAPYTVNLEYRENSKLPSSVGVHEKEAELFYVLEGSGTLVSGGKMTADRLRIDGGESKKISKGDVFLIPEGTPHWISHIDQPLVLLSVHVPRPVPPQ